MQKTHQYDEMNCCSDELKCDELPLWWTIMNPFSNNSNTLTNQKVFVFIEALKQAYSCELIT